MKIARATFDDMQRMFAFFNDLEEAFGDVDDLEVAVGQFQLLRFVPAVDREAIGEIVTKHWGTDGPGVRTSWSRVLYGMDTLLRNCTDPDADTLEWRRDIRDWLESKGAEDVEGATDQHGSSTPTTE
ncbi:MAG TPA: hypothetical protein VMY37_20490 [Thermoguttaceae bacterium]|nr:hypothetical protein [Thermoguttaceae bacterium]